MHTTQLFRTVLLELVLLVGVVVESPASLAPEVALGDTLLDEL